MPRLLRHPARGYSRMAWWACRQVPWRRSRADTFRRLERLLPAVAAMAKQGTCGRVALLSAAVEVAATTATRMTTTKAKV